jgi:hypothetical protein
LLSRSGHTRPKPPKNVGPTLPAAVPYCHPQGRDGPINISLELLEQLGATLLLRDMMQGLGDALFMLFPREALIASFRASALIATLR